MKTSWKISWVVDGSSGATVAGPCTKAQALAYFEAQFAPYGYTLVGIA